MTKILLMALSLISSAAFAQDAFLNPSSTVFTGKTGQGQVCKMIAQTGPDSVITFEGLSVKPMFLGLPQYQEDGSALYVDPVTNLSMKIVAGNSDLASTAQILKDGNIVETCLNMQ